MTLLQVDVHAQIARALGTARSGAALDRSDRLIQWSRALTRYRHAHISGGAAQTTLLVVDDRADARLAMARSLTEAGYDVRETATGRDALRLARMPKLHLIVLDLVLRDMDGFDVLRALKADPVTQNIPVVVKTAFYGEENQQLALDAGAAAYFTNTDDPQALVAVVRQALGNWKSA